MSAAGVSGSMSRPAGRGRPASRFSRRGELADDAAVDHRRRGPALGERSDFLTRDDELRLGVGENAPYVVGAEVGEDRQDDRPGCGHPEIPQPPLEPVFGDERNAIAEVDALLAQVAGDGERVAPRLAVGHAGTVRLAQRRAPLMAAAHPVDEVVECDYRGITHGCFPLRFSLNSASYHDSGPRCTCRLLRWRPPADYTSAVMDHIVGRVEMTFPRLVRAFVSALLGPGVILGVLLAVMAPPAAGAQEAGGSSGVTAGNGVNGGTGDTRLTEPAESERPTVALVLSGGGAKGAAHVGVIEVLEALRVPVDMVVGTSMGAIIGGMYAAGYSPEDMARLLEETDWRSIFSDRPALPEQSFRRKQAQEEFGYVEVGLGADGFELPSGFITGQRLGFRLKSVLLHTVGIDDFDELHVPFRAVAADLRTGEAVVLEDGSLVDAMRASMSVPGVFAPIEIEDRVLVDGGVVNNFPVTSHATSAPTW